MAMASELHGAEGDSLTTIEEAIRAEHRSALATLSPNQRRALARIATARREAVFRNEHWREALKRIIAAEAQRRFRHEDESEPDVGF
jgi:hypothetical protein